MNKAIVLIDLMMKELKIDKYSDLAEYLGVTPGAISGWVKRNSLSTISKHATKKGLDINSLQKKLDELELSSFVPTKVEPQTMTDVLTHIKSKDHHSKLNDNIQKVLEFEAAKNPVTSPYSELFQILMGENKDVIFQILSDKLELENVDDIAKIKFIEDFEALIKHVVGPTTKLKMLDRLRGKCK